ncbi:hypothetical protein HYH02_003233 [Chlamydomonas schloesseri]|uniref:FAD-binding FR-type domain-containing protein n=1 Tax=Chlamydomonas schloesseri TaxID=2026947 RepID=A0A835WQS8_9CHLO|nr:hypothetical protein HYH02_003233 [Chlamydomonas schloesseri]|eukprot:KAG2452202.1 hypothetical protein HYH02_003233 [Chlamydomonas schloesseri]
MAAASGWAARGNAALCVSASLFFRLLILAGCVTFAFFWCVTPTRWYLVREAEFVVWRNSLILPYTFINGTTGRTTPLLSGTISWLVIWQWTTTLAVALGAAGLLWLSCLTVSSSASSKPSSLGRALRKALARVRRVLNHPVPPGGLWRSLLGPGGLSVLDLFLILFWFAIHAMWMYEMTMRILDNRRANPPPPKPRSPPPVFKAAPANTTTSSPKPAAARLLLTATHSRMLLQSQSPSPAPPASRPPPANGTTKAANGTVKAASPPPAAVKKLKPLPEVVQDSVAKYAGWVGRLDILIMFFPLPRCNFLHWLLGSDFPTLIKYHRWLGHGTLLVYSIHGITYMSTWAKAGTLTTMLNWGMNAGVNRLSGLIALCGGWQLWVTAIPFVRRRFFNLFYISHILGAIIFLLFGMMHRKDVATWIMPGIFLYLLDVTLRTIQQCFNATRVSLVSPEAVAHAKRTGGSGAVPQGVAASLSRDGGVLTLTIPCDQSMTWCGGDTVFLNVPSVSWWQWHPFTLANASATFDHPAAAATAAADPASTASKTAGLPFSQHSTTSSSDVSAAAAAAAAAAAGQPRERYMQVHIKKYNAWTRSLMKQLEATRGAASSSLALYVSGPYHPPTLTGSNSYSRRLVQGFRRHIFIAGGIGVTPALGMLQELIAARRAATSAINDADEASHRRERVTFVWVSRSADELEAVLPAEVLEEANRGKDGWLDMQLYITGNSGKTAAAVALDVAADATTTTDGSKQAAEASPSSKLANLPRAFSRSFATFSRATVSSIKSLHRSGTSGSVTSGDEGSAGGLVARLVRRGVFGFRSLWDVVAAVLFLPGYLLVLAAGGVRWAACGGVKARPLAHPYLAGGPLVWAAAVVLCFAGGFGGLITAQSYDGYISRTVAVRYDFSYVGMLQFAALGVGAVLGPALLALVMHGVCRLLSLKRSSAASPAATGSASGKQQRASSSGSDSSPGDSMIGTAAAIDTIASSGANSKQQQASVATAPVPTAAAYISAGRPDLKTILTHAAAPYAAADDEGFTTAAAAAAAADDEAVGVFVAGPARLVAAVADTCAEVNGFWAPLFCCGARGGLAFLELHTLTHEL